MAAWHHQKRDRRVALEMENRLLRQKLDQYIRHHFGGQQ